MYYCVDILMLGSLITLIRVFSYASLCIFISAFRASHFVWILLLYEFLLVRDLLDLLGILLNLCGFFDLLMIILHRLSILRWLLFIIIRRVSIVLVIGYGISFFFHLSQSDIYFVGLRRFVHDNLLDYAGLVLLLQFLDFSLQFVNLLLIVINVQLVLVFEVIISFHVLIIFNGVYYRFILPNIVDFSLSKYLFILDVIFQFGSSE